MKENNLLSEVSIKDLFSKRTTEFFCVKPITLIPTYPLNKKYRRILDPSLLCFAYKSCDIIFIIYKDELIIVKYDLAKYLFEYYYDVPVPEKLINKLIVKNFLFDMHFNPA